MRLGYQAGKNAQLFAAPSVRVFPGSFTGPGYSLRQS